MACKHEGGSDLCVRDRWGCCPVRSREYNRQNFVSRSGKGTPCDLGQACEYLVAADLLDRGLLVTKPININGAHDLHAKCGRKWYTLQVKAGRVNRQTGTLSSNRNYRTISSDILVAVDLLGKRVRYIPRNIPRLPQELRDADI
jgi:hypothetical protein